MFQINHKQWTLSFYGDVFVVLFWCEYDFATEGGEECMKSLLSFVVGTMMIALLVSPGVALAQGFGDIEDVPTGIVAGDDLFGAITGVLNVLLGLAALIAAIFILLGGVQYITSQGDEAAAAKAKNTIIYAVIGLIVIGLAYVIVNFTISAINSTAGA